jgi:hypothetical protein
MGKGFNGRFEIGTLKIDTGLVHREMKHLSPKGYMSSAIDLYTGLGGLSTCDAHSVSGCQCGGTGPASRSTQPAYATSAQPVSVVRMARCDTPGTCSGRHGEGDSGGHIGRHGEIHGGRQW